MTVAGVVLVVFLAVSASALPVDPQRRAGDLNVPGQQPVYVDEAGKLRRPRFPDTPGLDQDEYNRYWQEMVKENPAMLEHLKGLDPEQLAQLHPRVSERMARASEGVRNRLEEARRLNVDELRELQRLQQSLENKNRRFSPDSEWIAKNQALRDDLPENYNTDDIQKRMAEQRRVLEEIDRKRREEYENYQLQLEHQRREKLKAMNEEQRLRAERALEEQREQQKHHEKMNKPASKHQLEEVWEKDDGLKDEEFDPKTFFFLHDTNGDKILDPMELQALFYNEVKKAYGKNIDNVELQEELARMREYALKQLDKNGDTLITLQEFVTYTRGTQFENNEEWKGVVDEPESFTEEEMKKFEDDNEDYYDYEYDEEGNVIGFKTKSRESSKSSEKQEHPSPPASEGGAKGDPGANQHHDTPVASEGQRQTDEGVPGGVAPEQQEHQPDEGVPGRVVQQEAQEEGMPGQEQIHIQPAGTQREGQGQQFHKNINDPAPGHQ